MTEAGFSERAADIFCGKSLWSGTMVTHRREKHTFFISINYSADYFHFVWVKVPITSSDSQKSRLQMSAFEKICNQLKCKTRRGSSHIWKAGTITAIQQFEWVSVWCISNQYWITASRDLALPFQFQERNVKIEAAEAEISSGSFFQTTESSLQEPQKMFHHCSNRVMLHLRQSTWG